MPQVTVTCYYFGIYWYALPQSTFEILPFISTKVAWWPPLCEQKIFIFPELSPVFVGIVLNNHQFSVYFLIISVCFFHFFSFWQLYSLFFNLRLLYKIISLGLFKIVVEEFYNNCIDRYKSNYQTNQPMRCQYVLICFSHFNNVILHTTHWLINYWCSHKIKYHKEIVDVLYQQE